METFWSYIYCGNKLIFVQNKFGKYLYFKWICVALSVFNFVFFFVLLLFSFRSILECEMLVKATFRRNGLVYGESSSEDEGGGGGMLPSSEVIEIEDDDEDDDVIAVGCCTFILIF